ncbi:helix-turn-helix transcriptional regulator [Agrobacterium sp. P15N1-A]|uniref:helix-turn-helix transcriptional regulator n=1 Tax=Agrobacterium sp. P15N1-A TaxID=3342820 RepID=UPI0037D1A5AC
MRITQTETGSADTLLRDKEVAAQLRVSVPTVWRRVKDGTIPRPLKIGSLSRWQQSDISAVIEAAKAQRAA